MVQSLTGRLRVLERALVLERAEAAVGPVVSRFVQEWDSHGPNELELPRRLARAGFNLPTVGRAVTYLERCRRQSTPPDPDRLLRLLLPWTT